MGTDHVNPRATIEMLGELPLLRMLPPHSRRHHDSWTPTNTERRARASLAAGLAYHEWRQGGANDYEAREAAVAASQTVLPLPWQEASLRNAVSYATHHHPEWIWRGAQHTKKWRTNVRDNLNRRVPRH